MDKFRDWAGVGVIASALLAACSAGSPEVRKGKPDAPLVSQKPADEVASCITDAWQNGDSDKPASTMHESKTGYVVVWATAVSGHTGLVADVDRAEGGSSTRFYSNNIPGVDFYRNALAKCQ